MTTKDEKEIKAGVDHKAANPKTRTRKQNSTKTAKQKPTVSEKTDKLESSEEKGVLMVPIISDEPDISKYVTNVKGDVYAISGLPEEFIATLFAWVSRSPKSFKEHLKTALKELNYESSAGHFGALTEKAKAFHEKWTVGYGHSCYDADTDVLTRNGFKNWSEVDYSDELASVNPETMEIEYQKPNRLIAEPYIGQMYKIDRNRVDILVTPNHKIFAWPRHKIKDFETRKYQLIEAQDLKDKCYKVRLGGLKWNGDMTDTMFGYPIEPLLQLFGFFIGDGYIEERMKHAIQFHLKKQRKIDYLYSLCEQLGLTISANKNDKFYITSSNSDIGDLMSKCYDEHREKQIPEELMELDSNLLHFLFDGLMNSDGNTNKRNGSMVYDTSSLKLVNQIQHLILLLGWSSYASLERPAQSINQKDGWRLFIATNLLESMVNKVQYDIFDEWTHYNGMVYCAELPKYHTLIVRRNGRIHVSGNSVAEHAVAHVGIEKVSRLASAELELSNPFLSITEYSQRYQKPKRNEWYNPFPEYVSHNGPTRDMKPSTWHREFEKFMHDSFDAFEQLVDGIYTALKKEFVNTKEYKELQAKGDTKAIDRELSKLEKLAFEDGRYALPLAMYTQLGMTANGRAWRDSIAQIGISDHKEVHDLGENLKTEITKVLPVLLKYATPSQYQQNYKKRMQSHFYDSDYNTSGRSSVKLHTVDHEDTAINEIITHLLIENESLTYVAANNIVKVMAKEKRLEMIQDMLFEMQHFDTPPESFKQIQYKASFLISEANWHQLLRHNRKTDFTFAKPTTKFGIKIPPRVRKFGLEYILEDIAKKSEELYNKMVNALHKSEAEYVVLNAHKRPIAASFNLWEAYHLINLRTSDEAQWDIRETFEELYEFLCAVHPTLISKAKRRLS